MASFNPTVPAQPGGASPQISPSVYLGARLEEVRREHGVPALAGVLVRAGGDTVAGRAVGERKWDLSDTASSNKIQQEDRFCIGSVSKPFTGYLMAYLVQQRPDFGWTTRIRDVFPEFAVPAFQRRYRIRSAYLDRTLAELMSHNAGFPYAPANGYEMQVYRANLSGAFKDEYASAASLEVRRYNYVVTSLQDAPVAVPGPDIVYGGGCIIAAAMAERLTGKSYETLMQTHVFEPLGMTRTGLGRLASNGTPDGPWEHVADPASGTITPDATAILPQENFHSHGPAGAVRTTHADMARFIAANLSESGKPKAVVSDTTLRQAQALPDAAESQYTRGGWHRGGSGTGWWVKHNGDNCRSRAELRIFPALNHGYAAMSNVSNGCADGKNVGADAVAGALAVLKDMHDRWNTLF